MVIVKPTVLVFGAGTSMPFGFPSGLELFKEVLKVPSDHNAREFLRYAGFNEDAWETFKTALSLSGRSSVDAFLETRADLIPIGKAFMALVLMGKENSSALFDTEKKGRNFYDYLFEQMKCEFSEFGKNRLSIITYNYDRSFEHYLITVLQHSFNRTEEEAMEQLRMIPILHLHGNLGNLPYQNGRTRSYGANMYDDFLIAKDGIRIIHESTEGIDAFEQARTKLYEAEVICFLGVGYHPVNVMRLKLDSVRRGEFHGTAFGLVGRERETACALFPRGFQLANSEWDTHRFFRETLSLNQPRN